MLYQDPAPRPGRDPTAETLHNPEASGQTKGKKAVATRPATSLSSEDIAVQ